MTRIKAGSTHVGDMEQLKVERPGRKKDVISGSPQVSMGIEALASAPGPSSSDAQVPPAIRAASPVQGSLDSILALIQKDRKTCPFCSHAIETC